MKKQRDKRTIRGVSGERPKDVNSIGNLYTKLLPQFKEEGDIDAYFTAFEKACCLNQVNSVDQLGCLTPFLDSKAKKAYSQMDGVDTGDYKQF